jgi:hypothetical protein
MNINVKDESTDHTKDLLNDKVDVVDVNIVDEKCPTIIDDDWLLDLSFICDDDLA